MQRLLIAGAVGFTLVFSGPTILPSHSHAYAQEDPTINAAQEMIAWQQNYTAIITEMTSLFDTENISFLYETDFTDPDAVTQALSVYNAKREKVFANVASMKAILPPPERWDIQKSLFDTMERRLFKVLKDQYETLDETIKGMKIASDFDVIFTEAMTGDSDDVLDTLLIRQSDVMIKMLRSENNQVEAYLLAIPKTSPNYQLQEIFKVTNIMAIHELEWNKIAVVSSDLSERQRLGQVIRQEAKKIAPLLTRGRKNIKDTLTTYEKYLASPRMSAHQKSFIKNVIPAVESFHESFNVEEKLLQNTLQVSTTMESDMSEDEAETITDKLDLEYTDLVGRRLELITARMAMINQ